jgi:hypothetical protein
MIIGHYIFKFSVALCWRLPWLAGALRVKLRLGVCVHPLPSHYIMVLLSVVDCFIITKMFLESSKSIDHPSNSDVTEHEPVLSRVVWYVCRRLVCIEYVCVLSMESM